MLIYSIVLLFQSSENNSNLNHLEIGNVTEKVKVHVFFLFHKYMATRYEFNLHLDPYFTFLLQNVFVVALNNLSCSKCMLMKKKKQP